MTPGFETALSFGSAPLPSVLASFSGILCRVLVRQPPEMPASRPCGPRSIRKRWSFSGDPERPWNGASSPAWVVCPPENPSLRPGLVHTLHLRDGGSSLPQPTQVNSRKGDGPQSTRAQRWFCEEVTSTALPAATCCTLAHFGG